MTPITISETKELAKKVVTTYHDSKGFSFPTGSINIVEHNDKVLLTGLFDLDNGDDEFLSWVEIKRPDDPRQAVNSILKMPMGEAQYTLTYWPSEEGLRAFAKHAGLETIS